MEKQIYDVLNSVITDNNFELVEVNIVKHGKETTLEIVIDKEDGIDLDDCVTVTHLVNPILDEHDFINESYTLEVMSKGVE